MLELHVPTRAEFGVRQAWLADPGFMSYKAGWALDHPGYDRVTGCIGWPQDQRAAFEARLQLPADRHGYFYVRDTITSADIGHAHDEVDAAVAHIGINLLPQVRGRGLGVAVLTLLITRVCADTGAAMARQRVRGRPHARGPHSSPVRLRPRRRHPLRLGPAHPDLAARPSRLLVLALHGDAPCAP